jgi:C_GCAxxG_C_C family probable redox protein
MLAVGGHLLGEQASRSVRMATGFAGGVGGTEQEICGALSGGIMVIGALYGRDSLADDDRLAMELATRYRERFQAELGETCCGPLRTRVHAPGGLGSCSVVVERAAHILLMLLAEERCER